MPTTDPMLASRTTLEHTQTRRHEGAPPAPRRSIQRLPELLVNQIAAGEVVDRPASVVKELVENAIDARPTRITLELEQGGIELIRVTDDGAGIPSDELPLAIAPHATSKVLSAEDLDRIATMGFRGEALASISSVSRLSVRSRFHQEPAAHQIDVEGAHVAPVRPASGAVGTSVSVRNLFFNTPARRKFLRTPQTEQGHCMDIFATIAIAHPAIGFSASCDGRVVLDLPPGQGPRDRAVAVLGKELEKELIEVHADRFDDARGLSLWGLVGTPSIARATAKSQHLFLNGRAIRDKTVQHAVREAYRGLIEPGRYPTAVLMIEMDPGAVDVNVHPAKSEVRFRDQSLVHGVILRAVRDALRGADLTPIISANAAGGHSRASEMFGPGATLGVDGPGAVGNAPLTPLVSSSALVEFLRRPMSFSTPRQDDALDTPGTHPPGTPPALAPDGVGGLNSGAAPASSSSAHEPALVAAPRRDAHLQVHNSYVVAQDEHGLVIVDQHALHERVMFEALLMRITGRPVGPATASDTGSPGAAASVGSPLESQRLLVPAIVRLLPEQISRLDELKPLLDQIGVSLAPISVDSVGVHAFPTFLFDRNVDPIEFIAELFEKADRDGFAPGSENALHEVLDMMACKAAIKAGDRLSPTELGDLLRFRDLVERSSNCPHGRPTSIRLTIKELEKRFGRT